MASSTPGRRPHEDPVTFAESLRFTEAVTHFSARLIEKDYYCSVVLNDLAPMFGKGLVFKGGTCLSKVHSDFFRLSEDLDFTVSVSAEARRSDRRRLADPFKASFVDLPNRLGEFQITLPMEGRNESRQYNGQASYRSVITGDLDHLKVEISVREPLLLPAMSLSAQTLVLDPGTRKPLLPPVPVTVLSLNEAYAEKIRAALTRRDPAIRDFFDIDNAATRGVLRHTEGDLLDLVVQKLAVAVGDPVDLSANKVALLRAQIETDLKPVLRGTEYDRFDLDRAVQVLREIAGKCSRQPPSDDVA